MAHLLHPWLLVQHEKSPKALLDQLLLSLRHLDLPLGIHIQFEFYQKTYQNENGMLHQILYLLRNPAQFDRYLHKFIQVLKYNNLI